MDKDKLLAADMEKTQNGIPCSVNIQLYSRNLFHYFTIKC